MSPWAPMWNNYNPTTQQQDDHKLIASHAGNLLASQREPNILQTWTFGVELPHRSWGARGMLHAWVAHVFLHSPGQQTSTIAHFSWLELLRRQWNGWRKKLVQPRHVYSHDDVSIYQHIVHTFTIQVQVVAFQLPSISNRNFKNRQPFLQILVLIASFHVPDRSRSPNPKAKALTQSPARSEWFWNRMKSNYCIDQGVCEGENALSARIFVSPRAAQNNFCIGKTQSQNDIKL